MNSWIVETIQRLGQPSFSQLLNALLIRIPIVVVGKEERETNLFISNLAKLAPHREQVIFWTDFVTPEEADQLFENEKQNPENRRVTILCNANVVPHAVNKMYNYRGWLIAVVPKSPDDVAVITSQLQVFSSSFMVVHLSDGQPRIQTYGNDLAVAGTGFEDRITSKMLKETNESIARLSRLLAKKVDRHSMSSQLLSNVLSFDNEAPMIQQDVYEKELSEFVHAARRAMALLSRVKLVQELGIPARLDSQTLLDAIDYNRVEPPKLLRFIRAEYDEDFSSCLATGRMSRVGDWIEGMWGVTQ